MKQEAGGETLRLKDGSFVEVAPDWSKEALIRLRIGIGDDRGLTPKWAGDEMGEVKLNEEQANELISSLTQHVQRMAAIGNAGIEVE